ncbi:MAG: hypothetical protein JZD41_00070, partial [Thermoproteus sp.]|nr:hypothetical protein [Thermoproteus sp.]
MEVIVYCDGKSVVELRTGTWRIWFDGEGRPLVPEFSNEATAIRPLADLDRAAFIAEFLDDDRIYGYIIKETPWTLAEAKRRSYDAVYKAQIKCVPRTWPEM